MSTNTIPQNLTTKSGFLTAAIEGLDDQLEEQLGIDIEDYDEYYSVVREVLEDQADEGRAVMSILESISEDERVIDVAESMELHDYIRLNPDFDRYIEFNGDTGRLAESLFDAFYTVVVRAPERAIREYIFATYDIEVFDTSVEWNLDGVDDTTTIYAD